jgi:hypothetical protein
MDYLRQGMYTLSRLREGTSVFEKVREDIAAPSSKEFGGRLSTLELLFDEDGMQLGIPFSEDPQTHYHFEAEVFGGDWADTPAIDEPDDPNLVKCFKSVQTSFTTEFAQDAFQKWRELKKSSSSSLGSSSGGGSRTLLRDEVSNDRGTVIALVASVGADEPHIRMAAYKLPEHRTLSELARVRINDLSMTQQRLEHTSNSSLSLRPFREPNVWFTKWSGDSAC